MNWLHLSRFNRRYRQISLAQLLLAITAIAGILAVPTAYYQFATQAYRAEQEIVLAIQGHNGKVTLQWQGPSWISRWIGNLEVFNRVTHVDCDAHSDVPGVLDCVVNLKRIECLSVLRWNLDDASVRDRMRSASNCDLLSINYASFYGRDFPSSTKSFLDVTHAIEEDIAELRRDFPHLVLQWNANNN